MIKPSEFLKLWSDERFRGTERTCSIHLAWPLSMADMLSISLAYSGTPHKFPQFALFLSCSQPPHPSPLTSPAENLHSFKQSTRHPSLSIMYFSPVFVAACASILAALNVHASPANFTERAAPLAQVITKCTVPNTVALTFDDGPYQYLSVCASPLSWRVLMS